MNEGALAILDCLGFKGAWAEVSNPEDILSFFKAVASESKNSKHLRMSELAMGDNLKIGMTYLSDTIVISVTVIDRELAKQDENKGQLIRIAATICLEIVSRFLTGPFPFLLRGCITYGEFLAEDNFFLGPAVDEAASKSEIADGAFVWLTPLASKYLACFDGWLPQRLDKLLSQMTLEQSRNLSCDAKRITQVALGETENIQDFIQEYDSFPPEVKIQLARSWCRVLFEGARKDLVVYSYSLPLKTGENIDVAVLNTFALSMEREIPNLIEASSTAFRNPTEQSILAKKEKTQNFLLRCEQISIDEIAQSTFRIQNIMREERLRRHGVQAISL